MTTNGFEIAGRHEMASRATDFVRYGVAMALGKGSPREAQRIFLERWPHSRTNNLISKAVAGTTGDSDWAGPLAPFGPLGAAFAAMLHPASVVSQLEGVRRIPFRTR